MASHEESDFIKNSRVTYLKCSEGDLHEGEFMSLVCVDPKCTRKGLVCPVCRFQDHSDHKVPLLYNHSTQILSLKTFLSEVRRRFRQETRESSELASLPDYLRQLQNTRQSLLSIVKDTVLQFAEKIKSIEQKINANYGSLRKMVLTQTTISTKLPRLISLMVAEQGQQPQIIEPADVKDEFQKYAELIRYQEGDDPEKNKLSFFDNSRKLIEDYAALPGSVTSHLSTLIPELTKVLDRLPLSVLDVKSSNTKAPQRDYTFSTQAKKQQSIHLYLYFLPIWYSAETSIIGNTTVAVENSGAGGYVFVNEGSGEECQSISFKIQGNSSGYVSVGMGISNLIKGFNYTRSETEYEKHGQLLISSMGVSFQHKEPEKQDTDVTFVFGAGDVIDIDWEPKTKKLTFARRHGVEKFVMDANVDERELSQLKFMVGVYAEGDIVKIVSREN